MIEGLPALKLIREKKIKFPLLLWGSEIYLKDRIRRELINVFLEKRLIAFNYHEVKNGTFKINEILNILSETPLLSPGKIFFIYLDSYSKSDLTQLSYALEKINLFNTYFVGYITSTPPQELIKVINARFGTIVKVDKPPARMIHKFVSDMFIQANIAVQDQVVETLANDKRDLQTIKMETEKLIFYTMDKKNASLVDLFEVYSQLEVDNIFSLVDNLFTGQPAKSLKVLANLLQAGESPSFILVSLASQIKGAYKTCFLNEKEAGLHPFAYKKLKAFTQKLPPRYLELALLFLADADEKIKSGKGDSQFLLYQSILKIGQLWKTRLNYLN